MALVPLADAAATCHVHAIIIRRWIAAGSVGPGLQVPHVGGPLRLRWVLSGASPSVTFSASAVATDLLHAPAPG